MPVLIRQQLLQHVQQHALIYNPSYVADWAESTNQPTNSYCNMYVCFTSTAVIIPCLCFSSSHYYGAQVPDVDVRDWQPGYTHTVASAVHVTHVPEGQYKVTTSSQSCT